MVPLGPMPGGVDLRPEADGPGTAAASPAPSPERAAPASSAATTERWGSQIG